MDCAVHQCTQHALASFRTGRPSLRADLEQIHVCADHARELGDPLTQWVIRDDVNPPTGESRRVLLIDEQLRTMNEFVVTAVPRRPVKAVGPTASKNFVDGWRLELPVRLRGETEDTLLTLILPADQLDALSDQLRMVQRRR